MLCSYFKNPVNAGIAYISAADLYYRLVELYSLSTINSSLNIKNCIVFFNTLIINFHIYTIIYITRKYVMNQTNTHNNIIYADTTCKRDAPGGYLLLRNTQGMSALRVRTCPWGMSAQEHTLTFCRFFKIFLVETILL